MTFYHLTKCIVPTLPTPSVSCFLFRGENTSSVLEFTFGCLFWYEGPLDVSHIGTNGIGVVTTKAHPEHAGKHGACKVNKEVRVFTILGLICSLVTSYVSVYAYLHAYVHVHRRENPSWIPYPSDLRSICATVIFTLHPNYIRSSGVSSISGMLIHTVSFM